MHTMAGNGYFPPPPPAQFQSFSPQYPPPAQPSHFPQPWNPSQLCTSPPPSAPPTPYNPSAFTSPVLSPRDASYPSWNTQYPQLRPQSSVIGRSGPPYDLPPGNGLPTPAFSPPPASYCHPFAAPSSTPQDSSQAPYIPYNPSQLNLQEPPRPTTQCFELPSQPQGEPYFPPPPPPTQSSRGQQLTAWNSQVVYGYPPVNAPPTPALTPGSSGYNVSSPVNFSGPQAQYFPSQLIPQPQSQVLANSESSCETPSFQQTKPQEPAIFEISSHPSPPLQGKPLFSPPPVEINVNSPVDLQVQIQAVEKSQLNLSPPQQIPLLNSPASETLSQGSIQQNSLQSPLVEANQSLPSAPQQYQPQNSARQSTPIDAQPQVQPTEHIQSQPPPSSQTQDQWTSAQQSSTLSSPTRQDQYQPLAQEQFQSYNKAVPETHVYPPPAQQVNFNFPPPPPGQFISPPPEPVKSLYVPTTQVQSPPPASQYPPPPEPVKSQYVPTTQVQLSPPENQYPPPPPYSPVPNSTNLPYINNGLMSHQPPPASPQNGLTSPEYLYNAQTSQTSYPREKQEYEQSLLQSFQAQLQITSPKQGIQEKQQYEQGLVQSFQQQWQYSPTGQYPPEKQQGLLKESPRIQQEPHYPGVGQPQILYPPPQLQSPPVGLQQHDHYQSSPGINSGFMPPPPPFVPVNAPEPTNAPKPAKDDLKSSKTRRFLGDTLVGRVARSSVATVTSTVKMPLTLSPWGDNNPVTLPNVRYRDAVLFTTFAVVGVPLVDGASNLVTDAFGADTFISEIISSGAGFMVGSVVVKYGVFQIVEQAIDKGALEHILPEVERTIRTTSVKTLQVSIKHKLMGVEADLRFVGAYPTASQMGCDKGWFCPYLFASSRTPVIPRSSDFAIAQFFGPYVAADTAFTHKILSESHCVIPLCDPNPTHHVPHSRLLIFFTGISPFRAGMWSTSRRPGCAQILFHLIDGCPALVLPVTKATGTVPVCAWSPWTLSQMQGAGAGAGGVSGAGGYSVEKHIAQITQWVYPLVDWAGLYPCVRDVPQALDRILWRVLGAMLRGALVAPRAKGAEGKVLGKIEAERAGVVMFRF